MILDMQCLFFDKFRALFLKDKISIFSFFLPLNFVRDGHQGGGLHQEQDFSDKF